MQTTPRPFGILLLAMSGALLVNSVLGPLGLDAIDYDVSESLRNQLVGLEVVTIVLVVPWSAVAGIRALRGRPEAPLLAFGPASYTLYMYVQYVLGPEYAEFRPAQLLHLALVTLSGGLTLWAWSLSRVMTLPERSRRSERLHAAVLVGLALFVVMRYAGGLAASDPHASVATTALLTVVSVLFAGFALHVHRPLVHGPSGPGRTRAPAGVPTGTPAPETPTPPEPRAVTPRPARSRSR